MNKIYLIDQESIHGFSNQIAFLSKEEADDFSERTHIPYSEIDVEDVAPEKFLFCVIFSGRQVEVTLADIHDTGKRDISFWSPTRCTVFVASPSVDEAEDIARQQIIDFVNSNDELYTDVRYAGDGTVLEEYKYKIPTTGLIREAILHYIKKDADSEFNVLFEFALTNMLKRFHPNGCTVAFLSDDVQKYYGPFEGVRDFDENGDPLPIELNIEDWHKATEFESHNSCDNLNGIFESVCGDTLSVYAHHRPDVERIFEKLDLNYVAKEDGTIKVTEK